jgi:serine protease Do
MYKKLIAYTFILCLLCFSQPVYSHHTPTTAVIERIMPAVVDVVSERYESQEKKKKGPKQGFVPFTPQSNGDTEPVKAGSGFVISSDGYVVTNAHVILNIIDKKGSTHLTFENGEQYEADLINYDKESDIALLKIKEGGVFPFVKWGNTPEVGEKSIAIGSPMNLSFTATFGMISAIDRFTPSSPAYVPFIQTDATMNPGNSGGPLFNSHGELIGINTMIITAGSDAGSIGLGFAIDGDYAQSIIERLKTGEKITRPLVGIIFRGVTKKDYEKNDMLKHQMDMAAPGVGSVIEEVIKEGPSENLLRVGDIIIALDGEDVKMKMLATEIAMRKPNTDAIFSVVRDNDLINVVVKLGEK